MRWKKIKELTLKSKSVDKYDILGAKYHSEDNNLNKMESYDNLNKINQKEILTEEQIRQKNIHDKSGDDESSGSSSSLALAITLPIIGILVIAVVILIIMRRKSGSSSDNIEKLTYN